MKKEIVKQLFNRNFCASDLTITKYTAKANRIFKGQLNTVLKIDYIVEMILINENL